MSKASRKKLFAAAAPEPDLIFPLEVVPVAAEAPEATDARFRLIQVRKRLLSHYCIGQVQLVDALLLALLTKEHCILIGPYGCNKSGAIRALIHLSGLDGMFYRATLNTYTAPDALLGPYSVKALRDEDRFRRNLSGTLAEAQFAFIGEVFRGNAATRSSLHTILSERDVENDGVRVRTPLETMFCDSNSYPHREEDRPFYDRLLLRVAADYINVQDFDAFTAVVSHQDFDPDQEQPLLDYAALRAATQAVEAIPVPAKVLNSLFEVWGALAAENIIISPRRIKRAVKCLKAEAWLRAAAAASAGSIGVLQHVLWDYPDQQNKLRKILLPFQGQSSADKSVGLTLTEAQEIMKQGMGSGKRDGMFSAYSTITDMLDLADDTIAPELIRMQAELQAAIAKIDPELAIGSAVPLDVGDVAP